LNVHPDRKDIIIGGHKRVEQWKKLGNKSAPCNEVSLTEDKEKKLNLRLNKNGGSFDYELVKDMMTLEELIEIGFRDSDFSPMLSDYENKLDQIGREPIYPIMPKFDEKYSSVVVFCKTEIDFNWIANFLELEKKKDYKSSNLGLCRVIDVKQLQEKIEKLRK
jgi:hypothetical protein